MSIAKICSVKKEIKKIYENGPKNVFQISYYFQSGFGSLD